MLLVIVHFFLNEVKQFSLQNYFALSQNFFTYLTEIQPIFNYSLEPSALYRKKSLEFVMSNRRVWLKFSYPVYKRKSLSFSNGLLYITSKKKNR